MKRAEEYLALSGSGVFATKYRIGFLTDNHVDSNNKHRPVMKAVMNRNSMDRFALAPVITAGLCI